MASPLLDLKKFKHIKSDDKSTTLQHRDGHTLILAHKTLSPDNQKALAALAKLATQDATPIQADEARHQKPGFDGGGGVGSPDSYRPVAPPPVHDTPANVNTPSSLSDAWNRVKEGVTSTQDYGPAKKACGGEVHKYAEGDMVQPEQGPQVGVSQAPDIGGVQQIIPHTPEVPKDQLDTQKLYNQSVMAKSAVAGARPDQMRDYMFGQNGEPPKAFDSSLWQQAMQSLNVQQATAQNQSQSKLADTQAENLVRQQANIAPLPLPTQEGQQPSWMPQSATQPQQDSMQQAPDQQALGATPTLPQQPQPKQPAQTGISNDPEALLRSGANQAIAGIGQQAEATGALGKQQAAALQQNLQSQRDAQVLFKQHNDQLESERQNHMQDIRDGYIDPEQYWTGDKEGNGSHSKIAAGIGMILGGFNPTSNPNAAINFLKYQMDRNLEAQKTNLSEKNNMLYANLQQFHNIRDAADMTKAMQTDIMTNELQKAAATAATPMAKAMAMQAAGKLQMDLAPQMQVFAMRRAMQSLAGSGVQNEATYNNLLGYMRTVNPEYAKELESRMVPGVGVSQSQPIPQGVREQLLAKQDLDMLAKDLLSYAGSHTNLIPGTAEYNTGAAKAFNLKQKYREAQLGGILRQGEMPLLDKVLDANPAGVFKELNSIPKLKEMINLNGMSKQNIQKSYGIVPWQGQEQQVQQAPAVNPREGQTGTLNGKRVKMIRGQLVPQ